MDYQIRWSLKAAENLESICDYIAKDSPYYASITAQKILDFIDTLSLFPELGKIVHEYENPNIRELIHKSYRIVYRLKDNIIEIAAICHTSRNELKI
jgi:toxin ParE1/3/4